MVPLDLAGGPPTERKEKKSTCLDYVRQNPLAAANVAMLAFLAFLALAALCAASSSYRSLARMARHSPQHVLEQELDPRVFRSVKHALAGAVTAVPKLLIKNNDGSLSPLVVDVTSYGEFPIIWNRLFRTGRLPKSPSEGVAVEIGGGSGILGSQIFNFVQLGWRGLVVEPFPDNAAILRREFSAYENRFDLEQCALGDEEGITPLYVFSSASKTSNCIGCDPKEIVKDHKSYETVNVKVRTVAKVFGQYDIPKNAELLSIDAEGMDVALLRQTFAAGFRPIILIIETMLSSAEEIVRLTSDHGYRLLTQVGGVGNHIYELIDLPSE